MAKHPLLTREEERELGKELKELVRKAKYWEKRLKKNPDDKNFIARKNKIDTRLTEIKNEFVHANIRLVVSIAKGYQYSGLPLLDLIDEGNIGLLTSLERYDYVRARFATFATWWIRQAIIKAINDKAQMIRIPIHREVNIKNYKKVIEEFIRNKGRTPQDWEIADYLGWSIEKTLQIKEIISQSNVISLDVPTETNLDEHNSLVDKLPDTKNPDLINMVANNALYVDLQKILSGLGEREQKVIKMRFGFETGIFETLERIAEYMGVTRERIRQIEAKALEKIRSMQRIDILRSYLTEDH